MLFKLITESSKGQSVDMFSFISNIIMVKRDAVSSPLCVPALTHFAKGHWAKWGSK